jgi:hypothetical protein
MSVLPLLKKSWEVLAQPQTSLVTYCILVVVVVVVLITVAAIVMAV